MRLSGTWVGGGLFLGMLAVAAALRVAAARGDLWLDEIWALYLSAGLESVWHVFTRLHQDNNQHLYTLYGRLVGGLPHPLVYRLPSLVAGVASVAIARWCVIERRTGEVLALAWLLAASYPMILYSSEARGYAPAIFFALVAFAVLRADDPPPRGAPAVFWLAVALGFLSHLTFAHVYLALLAWSVARPLLRREPLARGWAVAARWHAVPLVFLAVFYTVSIRHVTYGKGPLTEVGRSAFETILQAAGFPAHGLVAVVGGAAVITVAGLGILDLKSRGGDLWFFFPMVLLAAPLLVWLTRPSPYVLARHFVVCVPFLYVLVAHLLADARVRLRGGGWVFALALAVFTIGSAARTRHLLVEGRGSYREAVLFMADRTDGAAITVGTDHDFRNKMLLQYYAQYVVPLGKKIVYYDQGDWPRGGPEWLVGHSLAIGQTPAPVLFHRNGTRYELERSYPCRGPSGWSWFIYRKAGQGPG